MAKRKASAHPSKQASKPAVHPADKPAPAGYWRAPVHCYLWPPPGAADGSQIKGALWDLDTTMPLDGGQACAALVVLVDEPAQAFAQETGDIVTRKRSEAVRVADPGFAKFARLLGGDDDDRRRPHVIVTLRRTPRGPRFAVDVSGVPILTSDYGMGPDAAGAGAAPTAAAHS